MRNRRPTHAQTLAIMKRVASDRTERMHHLQDMGENAETCAEIKETQAYVAQVNRISREFYSPASM